MVQIEYFGFYWHKYCGEHAHERGVFNRKLTISLQRIFHCFSHRFGGRIAEKLTFVKLLGMASGIFMFLTCLCSEISFLEYGERNSLILPKFPDDPLSAKPLQIAIGLLKKTNK